MAPSIDSARFELATFTEFSDLGNVRMKRSKRRKSDLYPSFCINVYIYFQINIY